jgi:hypothetical protein
MTMNFDRLGNSEATKTQALSGQSASATPDFTRTLYVMAYHKTGENVSASMGIGPFHGVSDTVDVPGLFQISPPS